MTASGVLKTRARQRPEDDRSWTRVRKCQSLQTTDEAPPVASVTLAPDFVGYLFAVTVDSSWSETLCPLMRPPTALARRRANATPMSHGLSVFLLIDSGSAVTALWREGRAIHHCWTQEHWDQFSSVQCAIPDCVCLPSDSSRLQTQSERFDGTAETPGKRNTGSGLD